MSYVFSRTLLCYLFIIFVCVLCAIAYLRFIEMYLLSCVLSQEVLRRQEEVGRQKKEEEEQMKLHEQQVLLKEQEAVKLVNMLLFDFANL